MLAAVGVQVAVEVARLAVDGHVEGVEGRATDGEGVGHDGAGGVQELADAAWREPVGGVVVVAKTGRVIAGRVRWTVTPTGSGSRVAWTQTLVVPWLPRFLDPLVGLVGRGAYASGLRRILR